MQIVVTIEGVSINKDSDNRYCLNDLHRAAGGEKRHQPSDFLRIQQTIDLVNELSTDPGKTGTPPVEAIRGGLSQGTYVVKELVYAYAMWISAKFHLKVIRTFDAIATNPAPAIPRTYAEALQLAADQARQIDDQAAKIAADAPKVKFADDVANMDGTCYVEALAKSLGIGRNTFFKMLREDGFLQKFPRNYPYQRHINAGIFRVVEGDPIKRSNGQTEASFTPVITGKGQIVLQQRYRKGGQEQRTMKF